MPIPAIVTDLVRWISLGLTAMAGGVHETRFARPWIRGQTAAEVGFVEGRMAGRIYNQYFVRL